MKNKHLALLISGILDGAQVPENHRAAVLADIAKKNVFEVGGSVTKISTAKDDVTCVHIHDLDGKDHMLCHPGDMTSKQLDDFKRAQNNNLGVEMLYCDRDGDKDLIEVTVKR